MQNIRHNWRRLSHLILRGSPGKALFPEEHEGPNNLEKMLLLGDTVINRALESTLNQTTAEVLQTIKDFPKETVKNMVCFAPSIIRKLRDMNAMENSSTLQRRYFEDLQRVSGNISTLTIISHLISLNTNV